MIQITASIKDGAIVPDQPVQYLNELAKLEGKSVEIQINVTEVRSNKQNNYYWGTLIYMIHQDLVAKGWRANDIDTFDYDGNLTRHHVHMYMRRKFLLFDHVDAETGEVDGITMRSTSSLSKKEFMDYIEAVRQWAVELLDINIPDPNEIV